ARAPGRGLPARALGRALRLAVPAVQRAPRDPRRPDAPVGPSRAGCHADRAGARLDAWTASTRRHPMNPLPEENRMDVVSIDPRTGEAVEVVAQETTTAEVDRLCA